MYFYCLLDRECIKMRETNNLEFKESITNTFFENS